MTIITVTAPAGRLNLDHRRQLARSLTDAVLIPEVGQPAPPARAGFQVRFVDLQPDAMAIGGVLLSDQPQTPDAMSIDIAVMDAAWPRSVRTQVIEGVLAAMARACEVAAPSPAWWVTFRVIDEGSWGSRGGVLSILDLLSSGVFTADRASEIRAEFAARDGGGR
jgi:phenylpyruvate tautomerase PptA (4-oxalocrotonate tautomerase family)